MNISLYFSLLLGVAAVVFFLIIRIKVGGVKGMLAKILPSVCFVLIGVVGAMTNTTGISIDFTVLILFGLVFGLIGDILLDLKLAYPQDNDAYLFSGMAAFALGHISYLTAIYKTMGKFVDLGSKPIVVWLPILLAAVFACAAVFGGKLLKLKYGKFTVPSLIYAFLLSLMMFATGAGLIAKKSNNTMWIIMFCGAVMFVVSDLILSQQYFHEIEVKVGGKKGVTQTIYPKAKDPVLTVINHATYYAAQFLVALTIFFFTI